MDGPATNCPSCGRAMTFQVRTPKVGKPGVGNYFFACGCGRVVSKELRDVPDDNGGHETRAGLQ